MGTEYYRGRPVVLCDDALILFYCSLFSMISDAAGRESILCRDIDLAFHFHACCDRLQALVRADRCMDYLVLGLGD